MEDFPPEFEKTFQENMDYLLGCEKDKPMTQESAKEGPYKFVTEGHYLKLKGPGIKERPMDLDQRMNVAFAQGRMSREAEIESLKREVALFKNKGITGDSTNPPKGLTIS